MLEKNFIQRNYHILFLRYDVPGYEDLSCDRSDQQLFIEKATFGYETVIPNSSKRRECEVELAEAVRSKLCTATTCQSPTSSLLQVATDIKQCPYSDSNSHIGSWDIRYHCEGPLIVGQTGKEHLWKI